MTTKFGPNYKLTVGLDPNPDGSTNAMVIEYPLTIEFDIERTTASSLNQGIIKIYNLNKVTQSKLIKDRFSPLTNFRTVVLQAGYQELSTIFFGNLWEAYSYRVEASGDVITYLSAQDGGFAAYNSQSNATLAAGSPYNKVFSKLVTDTGLQTGAVGQINGSTKRGIVLNGNSYDLLTNNFNNQVFIDNNQINLLGPTETITADIDLISSSTGLLGTPHREETFLVVETIFEPRIKVGQIIKLQSEIDPRFVGQFKVMGIKHSGMISGAIGGDRKTTLQLFYGQTWQGGLTTINNNGS